MKGLRLLLTCLLLATMCAPLQAARNLPYPILLAQRDPADNGGMTLDEAVAQARRQYGGKVISAETARVDGRKVYRVKILTGDGRVKRSQYDARSGRSEPRGR